MNHDCGSIRIIRTYYPSISFLELRLNRQKFFATVQCIVFGENNTVLVGKWKRRQGGKETYTFPGGHIELGEDVIQAATRELMEETNLNGFVSKSGPPIFTDVYGKPYIHFPVVLRTHGRLKHNEEFDELFWTPIRPFLEFLNSETQELSISTRSIIESQWYKSMTNEYLWHNRN